MKPEILDELAAGDPRAVRSRRDLVWINRLMGNERWLLKQIRAVGGCTRLVEIGAGGGHLIQRIASLRPDLELLAIDLAPRPSGLDQRVSWVQGDIFEKTELVAGSLVVANLFLHHFKSEQLGLLGASLASACGLIFCEPERRALHQFQGRCLGPFLGEVTRHDMRVSIDAGFRGLELPRALGLAESWQWTQGRTWAGSHRLKGVPGR